jgi:hypothetical protein
MQKMFPKLGLLKETKGGGKEEKKIHNICVGTNTMENTENY